MFVAAIGTVNDIVKQVTWNKDDPNINCIKLFKNELDQIKV